MRTLSGAVLVLVMALGAAGIGCSDADSGSIRFVACADGLTVEDSATGLLWERKVGDPNDPDVSCSVDPSLCLDPHAVNNLYKWSSTATLPDGNAYTDFLVALNTPPGFSGHENWRLPIISEVQSIQVGPGVETVANTAPPDPEAGQNLTGQSLECVEAPCIDPRFAAVGGPTAPGDYWSASTHGVFPLQAWTSNPPPGYDFHFDDKSTPNFVRAVRAGSCSS
jgi:hypothetical protein